MCQSIAAGGRRCPIHMHSSHTVNLLATHQSELNTRQVDNLFRELRREGRHAEPLTAEARTAFLAQVRTDAQGTTVLDRVVENLRQAENESTPDSATMYAQQRLVTRAIERGNNLDARFQEIADRTGLTKTEVKAKFDAEYERVDVSYGAPAPEEWNTTTRARAVAAGLPYDQASVVALEKLYALPAAQTQEQVRRIQTWHYPTSNSHVNRFGYDEGRLEIAFNNDPEKVFAYHDVPEALWEHLRTANRPGRIYSAQLRSNPNYMYADAAAAEADAYHVRCASCGQFRAANHTCPERETREVIAAAGVPAEQIPAALSDAENEVLNSLRDQLGNLEILQPNDTAELVREAEDRGTGSAADAETLAYEDQSRFDDLADQEYAARAAADHAEYVNDAVPELPTDLQGEVEAGRISLRRAQDMAEMRRNRDEAAAEQASAEEAFAADIQRHLDNGLSTRAAVEMAEHDRDVRALRAYADELEAAVEAQEQADPDAIVNNDPEEILAQTEAAQAAPEAAPAGPSIRSTAGIVVPAASLSAHDVQQARPEVPERTFPVAHGEMYGAFQVADPDAPEYGTYAVTADNQYVPQKFDRNSLVAYSTTDVPSGYWHRRVLDGGEEVGSDVVMDEATREFIKNAPENMRFVMVRNAYGEPYRPKLTYDYNRYSINDGYEPDENGNMRAVMQLMRRPAVDESTVPVIPTVPRHGLTPEQNEAATAARADAVAQRTRALEEDNNALRNLLDSGEAVRLIQNASSSRRYTFDANLQQQPSISTAPATEIRAAIRNNKVALIPFSVDLGRNGTESNYVDDQGYLVTARGYTEISGQIAVRRNKDGVIEVISTERHLKCNCADYRAKYYCKHVSYAQRHMGNVVQQMLPDSMGAGRTVVPVDPADAASVAASHRLMTSPLRRRNDVAVVVGENGQADYLRVTGNGTSYSPRHLRNGMVMPQGFSIADRQNPTPEELQALQNAYTLSSQISTINLPPRMSELRAALRRSDVEVPVRVQMYESGSMPVITGTVTYNRQENADDAPTIRERHLQCTCAEYQENYDCRHVRMLHSQSHMLINAPGRGTIERPATNALMDEMNTFRNQLAAEREITDEIQRAARPRNEYNRVSGEYERIEGRIIDREQAQANIADRAAAAERERAERAERERQRRIQWEIDNRERLQREAEERRLVNAETVEQTTAYLERMQERWKSVDEGYTANPEKFYEDYKETLKRKRNKEQAVAFRTENVTDGICADEPGARQFGIELEFDIKPGVNRQQALRKIGEELHAAGLTSGPHQTHYHSAVSNGWANWSFEQDCTVDAELVSPLMKDTPEHWEQLNKALTIIRENGGIATTRTGSHVHVSTASYGTNSAKHVELLRTINNNDDILYRMASNPERGKHRGMQWCAPNVDDREGDVSADVESAQNIFGYDHSSHNVGVNFQSTFNPKFEKSNVEFRMWDGTLDAAVIQQQVAVSAAITDYAERNVMETKVSKREPEKRQRIGQGRTKEAQALAARSLNSHDAESFKEANGHVAEFFDQIFRKNEDRQAAMSLFAVTNWQENYR